MSKTVLEGAAYCLRFALSCEEALLWLLRSLGGTRRLEKQVLLGGGV